MKVASLLLLTSMGALTLPTLLLEGSAAPLAPAARNLMIPTALEGQPAQPPAVPREVPRIEPYALVPVTGREVVESVLATPDAGRPEPQPRHRHAPMSRSPERQARGLSGSA